MLDTFRWDQFTLQIFIRSSPELIYNSWATRSGLESFFRKTVEIRSSESVTRLPDEPIEPGDSYRWTGFNQEGWEHGKILAAERHRRLQFTFCSDKVPVTLEMTPYGDECLVQLTQLNMPTTEDGRIDWHLSCRVGWSFFLTNLKSVLENKTDLREKREDFSCKGVVNR